MWDVRPVFLNHQNASRSQNLETVLPGFEMFLKIINLQNFSWIRPFKTSIISLEYRNNLAITIWTLVFQNINCIVNKWVVFAVVTLNQYWSLFRSFQCICTLLWMNSCEPQYHINGGYLPYILTDRQRCTTVDRYRTRPFETHTNEEYFTIIANTTSWTILNGKFCYYLGLAVEKVGKHWLRLFLKKSAFVQIFLSIPREVW